MPIASSPCFYTKYTALIYDATSGRVGANANFRGYKLFSVLKQQAS